jgi:hypothetical protein
MFLEGRTSQQSFQLKYSFPIVIPAFIQLMYDNTKNLGCTMLYQLVDVIQLLDARQNSMTATRQQLILVEISKEFELMHLI